MIKFFKRNLKKKNLMNWNILVIKEKKSKEILWVVVSENEKREFINYIFYNLKKEKF